MEDIKVSISCATYNQETYIKDAIDGFLMQETDFPIEILIHDDASTDDTSKIIKEYEKRYPDIIRPIYQKENQFSKNVDVAKLNLERSKGKYIALCEGDDYWTDPFKLQKQVDYLEQHEDCSSVVHDSKIINGINNKALESFRPSKTSRILTVEEIVFGGGRLFATNSMVFRNEYNKDLPDFYYNSPVKDYPLEMYLSLSGNVYYMDEIMSDYRYLALGSWSSKFVSHIEKRIDHFDKISNMLDEVDVYSEYKYSDAIQKKKAVNEFYLLVEQGKVAEAKKIDTFGYYPSLSIGEKSVINLKQYLPGLATYLQKVKRKIANAK